MFSLGDKEQTRKTRVDPPMLQTAKSNDHAVNRFWAVSFASLRCAQRSMANRLKPIARRLKTFDKHIANAEKYPQHRGIYTKQPTRKHEIERRYRIINC